MEMSFEIFNVNLWSKECKEQCHESFREAKTPRSATILGIGELTKG